jgi:hypothetical protein
LYAAGVSSDPQRDFDATLAERHTLIGKALQAVDRVAPAAEPACTDDAPRR